jgi:hypothetical protein
LIASPQKIAAASVGDARWKKDCGRSTDSNQREKKLRRKKKTAKGAAHLEYAVSQHARIVVISAVATLQPESREKKADGKKTGKRVAQLTAFRSKSPLERLVFFRLPRNIPMFPRCFCI